MQIKKEMKEILDIIGYNIEVILDAELDSDGSLVVSALAEGDESGMIIPKTLTLNEGWNYL